MCWRSHAVPFDRMARHRRKTALSGQSCLLAPLAMFGSRLRWHCACSGMVLSLAEVLDALAVPQMSAMHRKLLAYNAMQVAMGLGPDRATEEGLHEHEAMLTDLGGSTKIAGVVEGALWSRGSGRSDLADLLRAHPGRRSATAPPGLHEELRRAGCTQPSQ